MYATPIRLTLIVAAIACTACPGNTNTGTSSGDAGPVDAGSVDGDTDAGPSRDGGPPDSGSPDSGLSPDGGSGQPSLALTVAANPNSVLTAIGTLHWSALVSVSVTAAATGLPQQATPVLTLADQPNPVTIPLLPLKARTTYTFTAVGADSSGTQWTSNSVTFTTGTLPAGVPAFNVADGGMPGPGYTLLDVLPNSSSTEYLTAVDATGAPVWYYAADPPLGGDFQEQPDGTFTVAVDDPTRSIPGFEESLTVYRQIDELGNTIHTWTALDVPDASPPVTIAATDDHEIRLQPNGDALLFGFMQQTEDLTSYGGQQAANVVGDVLERVTESGDVTFSWNALTQMSVANIDPATTSITGSVVDFSHANSIDVMDDGNYLISLRNFSQILKIDSTTGAILWKLGGKDSDFTFTNDPLQGFSGQHGARELANGDILLFDDGDGHGQQQSRAVEYSLDLTHMTANLVWSFEDSPPVYTFILGFAQRLPSGNTLIAWGKTLDVQEVDTSGDIVWDLSDPRVDYGIYRAFRIDPLSPLALVGG